MQFPNLMVHYRHHASYIIVTWSSETPTLLDPYVWPNTLKDQGCFNWACLPQLQLLERRPRLCLWWILMRQWYFNILVTHQIQTRIYVME